MGVRFAAGLSVIAFVKPGVRRLMARGVRYPHSARHERPGLNPAAPLAPAAARAALLALWERLLA